MRTEVGFGLSHEHYPYFRIVEIYKLNKRFLLKWPLDKEKLETLSLGRINVFNYLSFNTTEYTRIE